MDQLQVESWLGMQLYMLKQGTSLWGRLLSSISHAANTVLLDYYINKGFLGQDVHKPLKEYSCLNLPMLDNIGL